MPDIVLEEDREFANNAPLYEYKCRRCGLVIDSHFRESLIWSCPICAVDHRLPVEDRLTPLYRYYGTAPAMPRVWHGHECLTTGQWITDRKQFKEALHVASEQATERLGMEHRFVEADPSDHKHLGLTEEGLDATHDAHVKLGFKESKGNFVFPLSTTKPTTATP